MKTQEIFSVLQPELADKLSSNEITLISIPNDVFLGVDKLIPDLLTK